MTFPSIGLSLCVRRQSCHTSSWHSVVLVIGSVRCFSPQRLSIASCSYQLGWVLWKIAVAKQSWNKTYSGSIPIKDKGERGQAESKFSLQVTDLAPVKREGKDEKLSRNNSDHSAAPREPWQSPKVLVQRTLLSWGVPQLSQSLAVLHTQDCSLTSCWGGSQELQMEAVGCINTLYNSTASFLLKIFQPTSLPDSC